ncbi:hypothetical protein GLIP_1798 [Aliiglaciecola lipolytica E3]|uniref:Uncharacterized protein n=1 Tax=Aliiglaciecola lipolytica E3 TaxID=1127673 RepID=K6Y897_9ALTE|nr:hypothetical protein GLIP_1798 [Aliiglaciecola lipolytica E3]
MIKKMIANSIIFTNSVDVSVFSLLMLSMQRLTCLLGTKK